jgi:hypothetical protein
MYMNFLRNNCICSYILVTVLPDRFLEIKHLTLDCKEIKRFQQGSYRKNKMMQGVHQIQVTN